MKKIFTIKCIGGFRDGNAYPRAIDNNEILEVDELTFNRLKRSDPSGFEVVDVAGVVPESTKSEPDKEPEDKKEKPKKESVLEKLKQAKKAKKDSESEEKPEEAEAEVEPEAAEEKPEKEEGSDGNEG